MARGLLDPYVELRGDPNRWTGAETLKILRALKDLKALKALKALNILRA